MKEPQWSRVKVCIICQDRPVNHVGRELKGLIAGKQFIGNADCLLLVETAERNLDIPKWIHLQTVEKWLLTAP